MISTPTRYETVVPWCNYTAGNKRWADAEKCGRELLSINPGRSGGYSMLAFVYTSQQRWSDLDKVLADGERNVPDNLSPYFNAGRLLADSGADNARGERYLRKYLSQDPEPSSPRPAVAHWRLAQIMEKSGRKPEAVAELETATRLQPKFEAAEKDLKRLK